MRSFISVQQLRFNLIALKQSILDINPSAFSRNTKSRLDYCSKLSSLLGDFTPFQKYAIFGLLLSDASLQASSNGRLFRVKMQQSVKHSLFINHILADLLPEWVVQTSAQQASKARADMYESPSMSLGRHVLYSARGRGKKFFFPGKKFFFPVRVKKFIR